MAQDLLCPVHFQVHHIYFSEVPLKALDFSTLYPGTRNPQLLFLRRLATVPVSLQMHNGDYVCECFYLLVLRV